MTTAIESKAIDILRSIDRASLKRRADPVVDLYLFPPLHRTSGLLRRLVFNHGRLVPEDDQNPLEISPKNKKCFVPADPSPRKQRGMKRNKPSSPLATKNKNKSSSNPTIQTTLSTDQNVWSTHKVERVKSALESYLTFSGAVNTKRQKLSSSPLPAVPPLPAMPATSSFASGLTPSPTITQRKRAPFRCPSCSLQFEHSKDLLAHVRARKCVSADSQSNSSPAISGPVPPSPIRDQFAVSQRKMQAMGMAGMAQIRNAHAIRVTPDQFRPRVGRGTSAALDFSSSPTLRHNN
eukprot:CAMPEP_0197529060 /NCGR_PEP_ID=MMETSP1318-20131121/27070_1 /TAXON_ID=552666 /ORGANISM="Partenskyella glossopodia, Strain RCC365" /LENGTH=292 /DNA_ID=CAMNT_0043084381 /DNA_START=99 /DNA_END=977 /DNA_ORIENTATION=+